MKGKKLSKKQRIWLLVLVLFLLFFMVSNMVLILPYEEFTSFAIEQQVKSPTKPYFAAIRNIFTGELSEMNEPVGDNLDPHCFIQIREDIKTGENDYIAEVHKEIYYTNSFLTEDDVEWVNDDVIRIQGRELNIHLFVYDYRLHFWR